MPNKYNRNEKDLSIQWRDLSHLVKSVLPVSNMNASEAKRLLNAGANPDAKEQATRIKPFDYALNNKDIGLVIELYKKGAKRTR